MTAQRVALIRETLASALETDEITVLDEGHLHKGHAGAKTGLGHFAVTVRSAKFDGLSMLDRHRLVYEILGDLMQTDIHALSIRAMAENEAS